MSCFFCKEKTADVLRISDWSAVVCSSDLAWMLPMSRRAAFYKTADKMAWTLRRLMAGRLIGMAVEGCGTRILLMLGGVPIATLLGVLTGILAFLPNIGAIISGRSEEHTSELQSLMRISYDVCCLKQN